MASRLSKGLGLGLLCAVGVSCGNPPDRQDFEVGDGRDPIVKRVQELGAGTMDTIDLTIKNGTGYGFTQGALLFSAPFTVNTAPSTAMINFVQDTSSSAGNATTFITATGATVGTTGFVVPAIAKGATAKLTITVPANTKLTYLARVASSIDDFVVATPIALTNGVPGTVTVAMKGYDLRGSSGLITLGNGTTGASPASTTVSVLDKSDCPTGTLAPSQRLFSDTFSSGAGSTSWPVGFGWDGEFNGDWYSDGITARLYNPNWGGADPAAPIPTVTGFWKRIDLCPGSGSKVQFQAKIVSSYTDATSDSTLVLYFFDRGGALLSTAVNTPVYGVNDRNIAVFDAAIPANARQIAVAPMARFGTTEKGDVFFDSLTVDYEVATAYTTTSLATDAFSSSNNSSGFGKNQPTGWSEFGGDWYAMSPQNWATLGNPSWGGGAAGVDTGLVKTFALTGLAAGDLLNVRIFAAATFTDPSSFVRLRVLFNNSTVPLESDRQVRGYGFVDLRRQPIPAGATSATVIVNAYLGSAETSSLYVDDFSIARTRNNGT